MFGGNSYTLLMPMAMLALIYPAWAAAFHMKD
jgi:hypothetical protein